MATVIRHAYEKKLVNGDEVVIDNTTRLMWHQSGSRKYMKWVKVDKWLEKLNRNGYAGFNDWRLPTVEEAASLLEPDRKSGNLYIDSVFDNKQGWIWTGDIKYNSKAIWIAYFSLGNVSWSYHNSKDYVRPVRSKK